MMLERTMLRKLYKLDHLYGLLLTFGLALIIQGVFRNEFGSSGQPYAIPESCRAAEPGLHVPADLPRLGDRRLAGRVPSAPGT
jgi:branched-subunit amino acid ABC-type transport system permease component